jgi:hypothetical protein
LLIHFINNTEKLNKTIEPSGHDVQKYVEEWNSVKKKPIGPHPPHPPTTFGGSIQNLVLKSPLALSTSLCDNNISTSIQQLESNISKYEDTNNFIAMNDIDSIGKEVQY